MPSGRPQGSWRAVSAAPPGYLKGPEEEIRPMPAPPLVREIAWLEPVDAYAALADLPAPTLLESARVDSRLGRFSYSAADPFHLLTSKDGRITCDGRSRTFTGD